MLSSVGDLVTERFSASKLGGEHAHTEFRQFQDPTFAVAAPSCEEAEAVTVLRSAHKESDLNLVQ